LYKTIYVLSHKISKRDRLGIFSKIESICLALAELIISASFENRNSKMPLLCKARIKIEVLKRLIRMTPDLNIIQIQKYVELESELQEISKMTNGWIKYLHNS